MISNFNLTLIDGGPDDEWDSFSASTDELFSSTTITS
jgi:hypothetical protein